MYLTGSTLQDTFFRVRGFLALPTIVSRSLCSPVAFVQAEIVTLSLLTLYPGAFLSLHVASVGWEGLPKETCFITVVYLVQC